MCPSCALSSCLPSKYVYLQCKHAEKVLNAADLGAGKDQETMKKDMGRNRWFTPTEAIDYGIIDRVVEAQDTKLVDRKDYSAPAQQRMVEPRAGGRVPAGASADAGL